MRNWSLWLALTGVLAAGCTASGGDGPPSSTSPEDLISAGTTVATVTTTTPPDPALSVALPVDPKVRKGTLDNGLVYYLRFNDSPGGRAELRLLVDAGSVQEEPDQSGVAHFLEHMMFNGTERFPRNELIAVLESFGPRFGPDINARTSFDETVYELSLESDKEGLIELGLQVLREWAADATLAEADVVAERGVVLDEWRLRAQGFGGRISEAYQELILPGTGYEGRVPIGDASSIAETTPEQLRRFYRDWYRPDNMALVVVGDIEVDAVEEQIVELFSDLEPRPGPEWAEPAYKPPNSPRVRRLLDQEAAGASATLLWPRHRQEMETVGDYQAAVVLSMALDLFASRLNDDALRGDAPLLGGSPVEVGYARSIGLVGVDVDLRPEDSLAALRTVLEEAERLRVHGISQDEFQRALDRFLALATQAHQRRETTQDTALTQQIVSHHLAGGHLMDSDQKFEIDSDIAARLTAADIEAALANAIEGAPLVLVIGPDEDAEVIPSEDEIMVLIESMDSVTVEPRPEEEPEVDLLMARPDPVEPLSSQVDGRFGYTTLEYPNGATVYLWESDISEEAVFLRAESFGGTSQIAVEDLAEAFVLTDVVARSGVGPADAPTMRRYLADRVVSLSPWLSETREGFTGSSSAADIETLLQLLHLHMTAPRFDDLATEAVLGEIAEINAAKEDIPDLLFEEALIEAYYGEDPRYFAIPSSQDLADFDLDRAEQLYLERFGDAGDFAFALVGDLTVDQLTELASSYIGTLPSSGEDEGFVDHQPLPPREVQIAVVQAGAGEQGRVGMFFTNPLEPDLEDRVTARLLELVVNARLRDRVREELSATYSIFSSIDLQRDPDPFAESFVNSTGHPDDLALISDEVMTDLTALQDEGPTPTQFATAVEQLRTELDLIDNPTLADALITSHLYPDQPVLDLANRHDAVEGLTREDVRDLARIVYNPQQRIEVRLVPRR